MNKDLIEKIDFSLLENYDGPKPDDNSKLSPLWEPSMMWTLDILAKELGVKKYDVGDGSENLEQDYVETVLNILREAGYEKVLSGYAVVPKEPTDKWVEMAAASTRHQMTPQFLIELCIYYQLMIKAGEE